MWKWEQYFVFSTIRNPYNRMRSSYNYCKPDYHWEEFCQDPSITNGCSASNRPKEKIHSADVHYQFPIHWAYHGWYGWHLDYIIRVEALDKGINEVTSIINDRASMRNKSLRLAENQLTDVNVNVKSETKESHKKESLCKYFTGQYAMCGHALEKTMDPRVLGYDNYCD